MDDLSPVGKAVAVGVNVPLILAVVALDAVWVWTAFTGGTMPLLGWEVDGGVGFGLLWLVLLSPVLVGLASTVAMFLTFPVLLLLAPFEVWREKRAKDSRRSTAPT